MNDLTQGAFLPKRLQFQRIGDLAVHQPDWLVRDLMESNSLVLLIGQPSAGKSLLSLDLGACLATGIPWHGHRVIQGPVLYIAGEGQSGLARRRAAWERQQDTSLETAALFVSTSPTHLTDDRAQIWLRAEVERFANAHGAPLLIVLDTLARNFGGGDENSAVDMNRAVASMDALRDCTGATVLVVHHTGHANKDRGRGSTVLRAAADAEFLLERYSDGVIRLSVAKMKDAAPPPPMALRLAAVDLGIEDSDGEPIMSAALVSESITTADRPGTPRGKNQLIGLEQLRALVAANDGPAEAAVALDAWRAACQKAGLDRSRFAEAKNGLCKSGAIRLEGDSVFLNESSETVRVAPDSHGNGACESCEPFKGVRTFARNIDDHLAEGDSDGNIG